MTAAALQKAVVGAWATSGLDAAFRAFWPAGVGSYPVLHDQQATPGQPFPYCVMEQVVSSTTARMSAGRTTKREVRDVTVLFHIHAAEVAGDGRSAKEIAAYLANEVMRVFGGHPTASPLPLQLDHGRCLLSQYQNDFAVRVSDTSYQWTIEYRFRVDVPVAV